MNREVILRPGPVGVRRALKQVMFDAPDIGHRDRAYEILQAKIVEKLKVLFDLTNYEVLILTSAATGALQSLIENCMFGPALFLTNGAFSKRWLDDAIEMGKTAFPLNAEWGHIIEPSQLHRELKSRQGSIRFAAAVHSETSTGALCDINALDQTAKAYDSTILTFFDVVSSGAVIPVYPERIGVDGIVLGTQKGFSLPPGLAILILSPAAVEIIEQCKSPRFGYFNLKTMLKFAKKNQTPYTPNTQLMFGLEAELDYILDEGIENRGERHRQMALQTREWCRKFGFELFLAPNALSPTLTVIKNNLGINLKHFIAVLLEKGVVLPPGYGKLEDICFRLQHLDDTPMEDFEWALQQMTDTMSLM